MHKPTSKTILILSLLVLLQPVAMTPAQDTDWNISSFSKEIRDLTTAVNPAVVQIYTSSFGALVGAQAIGVDMETDLAALKIDGTNLPFLPLGDSDALHQGQLVFAFGSPMGLTNSVSMGVVSTVARQLERGGMLRYLMMEVE